MAKNKKQKKKSTNGQEQKGKEFFQSAHAKLREEYRGLEEKYKASRRAFDADHAVLIAVLARSSGGVETVEGTVAFLDSAVEGLRASLSTAKKRLSRIQKPDQNKTAEALENAAQQVKISTEWAEGLNGEVASLREEVAYYKRELVEYEKRVLQVKIDAEAVVAEEIKFVRRVLRYLPLDFNLLTKESQRKAVLVDKCGRAVSNYLLELMRKYEKVAKDAEEELPGEDIAEVS